MISSRMCYLQVNQLETQLGLGSTGESSKAGSTQGKSSTAADKGATRKATSLLPAGPRQNPYEGADFEAAPVQAYSLQATVKVCAALAVTALHAAAASSAGAQTVHC